MHHISAKTDKSDTKWKEASLEKADLRPHTQKEEKQKKV